jgi:hypothetical protein
MSTRQELNQAVSDLMILANQAFQNHDLGNLPRLMYDLGLLIGKAQALADRLEVSLNIDRSKC